MMPLLSRVADRAKKVLRLTFTAGHVTADHNRIHDMVWNGYPGYASAAIYLDMDGVYNGTRLAEQIRE